jgi:uncharacterized protein (UPF0276 family)
LYFLDAIAERYPLVMHGVSLSIGGPMRSTPITSSKSNPGRAYPAGVDFRSPVLEPRQRHQLHDLLPLPYTEESLYHVAARVRQVQDVLQRPLVLENVSSYVRAKADEFTSGNSLTP